MIEREQRSLNRECKLCSEDKDNWGRKIMIKRKFVTSVDDPSKIVCTRCGYTGKLNK